jgi:hypothetical protein
MKRDISAMQEELLLASFGKIQEERDPQVALLTTTTTTTIPAVTSFTGKRDRNSFEHDGPQPQSIRPNKIPTCPTYCGNQGHRGNKASVRLLPNPWSSRTFLFKQAERQGKVFSKWHS